MSGPGGMLGAMVLGRSGATDKGPDMSSIDGQFTIETDGDVLSNNSEDGYTSDGDRKVMTWKVGGKPNPGEGPRAIVKLSQ